MNLNVISVALLTLLLFILLLLSSIDYKKKRVLRKKPFVSFIIPCYNDGETVEKTIRSIYDSYDRKNCEVLVINDRSTDNSSAVLRKLQKIYHFELLENKQNMGKAHSLNKLYKKAKSDILFFLDADTLLNKAAVTDVLARMQGGATAVSAPYKPINNGLLARMQEIEYNMLALLQGASNIFSTISLWGGCLVVYKKQFEKVGCFSESAIIEDQELALKLKGAGYRVEQSFCYVESHVPVTLKSWYKQKIRWTSGSMQNLIKYFRVWLRSPLQIIFIALFSVLSVIAAKSWITQLTFIDSVVDNLVIIAKGAISLVTLQAATFYYGEILIKNFIVNVYFSVFSLPYVVPMIKNMKKILHLLYVIPYSLVYYPVYSVVAFIGMVVGVIRYRSLQKGKRAW